MSTIDSTSRRVMSLKERARRHLLSYREATDGLDCGAGIAQHISASAAEHARGFDSVMAELAILDPNCPTLAPLVAP